MSKDLMCSFYLISIDQDCPVFFKSDGNRFLYPRTIKLLINNKYRAFLRINENLHKIKHLFVNGESVPFDLIHGECDTSLEFIWDTKNIQPNRRIEKDRRRSFIAIEVVFEDNTTIQLELQVKFYEKINNHLQWGIKFNHMTFMARQVSDSIYTVGYLKYF